MNILASYHSSIFQVFENYLRTENSLVEDDIILVLDKNKSSFLTYQLQPIIYTFKDLSESVFNILRPEYPASNNAIVFELDDITRKTNWL